MANQFDLRKFLNENKLTRASKSLNENAISLNDVVSQLQNAIDPANYTEMGLGSEEDILITMLENVQEISRNFLRNLSSPTKQLNKESGAAIKKIASEIEAYSNEDPGDAAEIVGEAGLDYLKEDGVNVPDGMFNEKMDAELEQALTMYNSGNINAEKAARKVIAALMSRDNYIVN
jgi:hypothetical protein